MREKLTGEALDAGLSELSQTGWTADESRSLIHKTFRFRNFSEAFAWMARAALAAEKLNHHPDWSNSYNRVDVSLTTHDAGGLTELDLRLARRMDKF